MAQQWMTLSNLEWPFHASRAISTVAELLVLLLIVTAGVINWKVMYELWNAMLCDTQLARLLDSHFPR